MKKIQVIDKFFLKTVLLAFCIFFVYRLVFDFGAVTSGISGVISFLSGMLAYFIWGFTIAFVLNQIMVAFKRIFKFIKRDKLRHILSIICTYVVTLGLIALFFVAVIPVIAQSISELAENVPTYVKNVQSIYSDFQTYMYDRFDVSLEEYIKFDSTYVAQKISDFVFAGDGFIPQFTKWITTTTGMLVNFVFGLIISLYMLLFKERLIVAAQNTTNVFVPVNKQGRLYQIARRANIIFSKFLFGKLIDSTMVGVIAYIGFLIIGVNYPALLAFVVGFANIIPYFGPLFGAILSCSVILFTNTELYMFFISLIFVIGLQQLDGWVLEPRILHGQIGVNPLIIIAGVSIGGTVGGFIGMIIGVPLLALAKELFYDDFILKKIREKRKAASDLCDDEECVFQEQRPEEVSRRSTGSEQGDK